MKWQEAFDLELPAKAKTMPQGYEVELIDKIIDGRTINFIVKMSDGTMFDGPRNRACGKRLAGTYEPCETRVYSSMKLILI